MSAAIIWRATALGISVLIFPAVILHASDIKIATLIGCAVFSHGVSSVLAAIASQVRENV